MNTVLFMNPACHVEFSLKDVLPLNVYLGLGLNNVNAVARYVVVAATLFRRGAGEGGCVPGSEPVPPLPRPPPAGLLVLGFDCWRVHIPLCTAV